MITVIHHSSDYDGIFCHEIARKFLPGATLIGWDFGMPRIPFPEEGDVYILDLPPDCMQMMSDEQLNRLIWIDHHKSSIDKWDGGGKSDNPAISAWSGTTERLKGYRIDGVAACRLTWQWFLCCDGNTTVGPRTSGVRPAGVLPQKQDFLNRDVTEPCAVMLAGEYDVWQHENSKGDDITFQFGLDAAPSLSWDDLLDPTMSALICSTILNYGRAARQCYRKRDADIITQRGFDLDFEGLKFRALNTARCNSQTFEAALKLEHDGCLGFYWNGRAFIVSMYATPHKPDIDLSRIAVKYGGGGHKGACGFEAKTLPWIDA